MGLKGKYVLAWVACFSVVFSMASQAQARVPRIAVMEIHDSSGKLSEKDVQTATDYLRGRITATRKFEVIDKTRQAEALEKLIEKSKKESYKDCRARSCQVPLGEAVSADTILRTEILYLGGVFTIQSEMVDLARGSSPDGATVDFDEQPGFPPARSLVRALPELVRKLVGEEGATPAPVMEANISSKRSPITYSGPMLWTGLVSVAAGSGLVYWGKSFIADVEEGKAEASMSQSDAIPTERAGNGLIAGGAVVITTGAVLFISSFFAGDDPSGISMHSVPGREAGWLMTWRGGF